MMLTTASTSKDVLRLIGPLSLGAGRCVHVSSCFALRQRSRHCSVSTTSDLVMLLVAYRTNARPDVGGCLQA
jgi:hypothetical protein